MLAGNRGDVPSGPASADCESNRLAEAHGEAAVLGKAMRVLTNRNLDPSVLNPGMLIDVVERGAFVSYSRARRQRHDLGGLSFSADYTLDFSTRGHCSRTTLTV